MATAFGTSSIRGCDGEPVPEGRYLLRVRGLKTNFYTYQGVVKALDGVDLDVRQGETVGIVGETGSGKSVTALSVLRLIPQPPGKIEEGEALVDIGADELADLEALRSQIRGALKEIFGGTADYSGTPVTVKLLGQAEDFLGRSRTMDPGRREDLLKKARTLREKLAAHDLLSMDDAALREIRGNTISMIFQEPMQALNPVYTIGDQIAESIILHRRRWLSRKIILRMRAEQIRARAVRAIRQEFTGRIEMPIGVNVRNPSRADLQVLIESLRSSQSTNAGLRRDLETLLAYERLLGVEVSASVFSRWLPKGVQLRLYERESLRAGWRAADIVQELGSFASVLGRPGMKDVPWTETRATGPHAVTVTPAPGVTAETLAARLQTLFGAREGVGAGWSVLGTVLAPPRVEGGRVVLAVNPEYRRVRTGLNASLLARLPIVKRWILHPLQKQALDEAAEVLRVLRIPDPERVVTMYPHELSGGMNQRAMIGIALACDPLLLIADEPTTALDVTIQAQILELMQELKRRGRPSIVLITHDLGVISEMCDLVCVMYAGHVIERASVRELFQNPLHPYTRGLLKAIPSHAERRDRLEVIKGSVPNLIYPPSGCRFHPRCPAVMRHCGWDVRDLEPAIKQYAHELGLPDEAISGFESDDPFALTVSFADGDAGVQAMAAIRSRIETERPSSVMLQALTGVAQNGSQLVFKLLKSRRPRDLEISPGHMVSCYLYEAPVGAT